jgi:DNA polymerase-3 subunit gamma/tau
VDEPQVESPVESEPQSQVELQPVAQPEAELEITQQHAPVIESQTESATMNTSNDQVVGHVSVGEESLPLMADVPPWEEAPAGWQGQASTPEQEQPLEPQAEQQPSYADEPEQPSAAKVPSEPKIQWTLADLDEANWANIFRDLEIDGLTRSIAANMVFAKRVGTQLTFTLEQGQTSMLNAAHQGRIRQSLEVMFACDLQLAIDIGSTETETPFARRERRLGQHQQAAVESLQADPYVDKLQQVFNGQLDLGTVEPVQSFEE